jgi:hypothetical protein
MLSLSASVRVFLAADVCDMRRGFDALAAMVVNVFRTATLAPPRGASRVELSRRELAMLLEGIAVRNTRESRRCRRWS